MFEISLTYPVYYFQDKHNGPLYLTMMVAIKYWLSLQGLLVTSSDIYRNIYYNNLNIRWTLFYTTKNIRGVSYIN